MSITCPQCSMTSHHPKDEKYGYCSNCHDYTSAPAPIESDPDDAYLRLCNGAWLATMTIRDALR